MATLGLTTPSHSQGNSRCSRPSSKAPPVAGHLERSNEHRDHEHRSLALTQVSTGMKAPPPVRTASQAPAAPLCTGRLQPHRSGQPGLPVQFGCATGARSSNGCARAVRRLHTPTFARVAAMGSNDQCEQFNYGDSDHEHCECYRIVIEPMPPLYVHDTLACHSTTVALKAKARTSNSYRRSKRARGKREPRSSSRRLPNAQSCVGFQTSRGEGKPTGASDRHFSATVQECTRAFGGTHTNMARSHRGGRHDRSAERSSAILVFGRVRYRGCDCGRDHTDLM